MARARRLTLVVCLLAALPAPVAAAAPALHAQRGAHTAYGVPELGEDTLSAFGAAFRSWGAVVEADVQVTADGVPVAIHDATLDRTTDCTGLVADRTLADLSGCRVDQVGSPGGPLGSRAAACPDSIPTIADVLATARDGGATVNLTLSGQPDRVMDVVVASGLPKERLIVASFSTTDLDVAQARLPGVATSLLTTQAANAGGPAVAAGRYTWLSPEWPVDATYVTGAHTLGLKVVPYTLDTAQQVQDASGLGVDALLTDDVGMARRALGLPDGTDPGSRSCPPPPPPPPPAPPAGAAAGPPRVELLVPSLASDAYVSPRMLLRWRGRGADDARAEGFLADVRPASLRRAADWRALVAGAPARQAIYTAEPGSTFVLRVRARAAADVYGPKSAKAVVVPLDDRSARIRRSGPWREARSSGAWKGRVARAAGRRARMALRFSGRRLRIVARRSAAAGRLAVAIDGRTKVVSTAGSTAVREVVFDSRRLRAGRHRLALRPAGGGRVEIDAIAPG
jgi:glycerophosphoryl diester phosphodiesterase